MEIDWMRLNLQAALPQPLSLSMPKQPIKKCLSLTPTIYNKAVKVSASTVQTFPPF